MRRFLFLALLFSAPLLRASVTCTNLIASGSSSSSAAYTTASITPVNNNLILLSAVTELSTGNGGAIPSSIVYNGTGLTFVAVQSQQFGSTVGSGKKYQITTYRALGTSVTAGTITINYSSAQTNQRWIVGKCSGIETGGTNGSAAVIQHPSNQVFGAVSPATVTMAAFASPLNATYAVAATNSSATATAGSDMTLLGSFTAIQFLASEYSATNVNPATLGWTSAATPAYGIIALELATNAAGIPFASMSPTSLSFGTQQTTTTSTAKTFTLSNLGDTTLTISSIALQTGTQYAISANTCGATLAASATCTIDVTFTPTSAGSQGDNLIVTSNDGASPASFPLTGSGITAVGTGLSFGTHIAMGPGISFIPPAGQVSPAALGENAYCVGGVPSYGLSDGVAALPVRCYNTALANTPSPGTTLTVCASGCDYSNFQTALTAVTCGQTLELAAGETFTAGGSFTYSKTGCDDAHYVTIQSSGVHDADFPAEGVRTTPCWSNVASLTGRAAYTCPSPDSLTAKIISTSTSPALKVEGDHLRLIGLELTRPTNIATVGTVVDMDAGTLVHHIIFDRCWVHGVEQSGNFPLTVLKTETGRGVLLKVSNTVAIINSYFSDFYCLGNGNCADAQSFTGGVAPAASTLTQWGNYKIYNNHLEGAAEGFIFGGGGGPDLTPTGCTPLVDCNEDYAADIEIRANLFVKPLTWRSPTGTSNGWPTVKNGMEFKNGGRALIEGNIIENTWNNSDQRGDGIVISPKNPAPGAPGAMTKNITIRYNLFKNTTSGVQIAAALASGACGTCSSLGLYNINLHNNIFDNMNDPVGGFDTYGVQFSIRFAPAQNIVLNHNTFVPMANYRTAFLAGMGGAGSSVSNFVFKNNFIAVGTTASGITGPGASPSCEIGHTTTIYDTFNTCWPGQYTFTNNVIYNTGSGTGWMTDGNGLGNFFPASTGTINFVNYNAGSGGDYHLNPASPYHLGGTDGLDIGANIDLVNAAINSNP